MNILFYTGFQIEPTKGGTERISYTLAKNLSLCFGYNCYSMSYYGCDDFQSDVFSDSIYLQKYKKKDYKTVIKDFLSKYKISVIINQGAFDINPLFVSLKLELGFKIILAHHFSPGWEENFFSLNQLLLDYSKAKGRVSKTRHFLKIFLYPILKPYKKIKLKKEYHMGYLSSDLVVLLSEQFKTSFMRYAKISDDSKFRFIPNMLSFDSFYPKNELSKKKKQVLIVARLEELSKRLSLALHIWKLIESSNEVNDWSLHVVGDGPDRLFYHKLAEQLGLKRIIFHGHQNPIPFYRTASIYMMTSRSESWGLSLTESQQMGLVPLAFDSYASLEDIISDGLNGYIIADNNVKLYTERMINIMKDENKRCDMAVQALQSSCRFKAENIVEMWRYYLHETCI